MKATFHITGNPPPRFQLSVWVLKNSGRSSYVLRLASTHRGSHFPAAQKSSVETRILRLCGCSLTFSLSRY